MEKKAIKDALEQEDKAFLRKLKMRPRAKDEGTGYISHMQAEDIKAQLNEDMLGHWKYVAEGHAI